MKTDVIKKIVIAILIVVAILLLLFIGKEVAIRLFDIQTPSISKSTALNAKKVDISMENTSNYKHITSDKYIYFVTTDGVVITDENGAEKAAYSVSIETPCVVQAGEYVIACDLGGTNVYVFKNTSLKKQFTTKKAIINISINENGYCVVVTEGDMQKRDVTLYNENGKELFVWTSGTKPVFDAQIANNNKNIIISSLDTQGKGANTLLSFYNISKEEPIETVEYNDEIIADIAVCENYVYAVGSSRTEIFTSSGDKKGEILYNDKNLLSYDVTKSGVVMSFEEVNMSTKRYTIAVYNNSGSVASSHGYDYISETMDATNNYIALTRDGLICVLDYKGRELKLINSGIDILDLSFVGRSKKIVGFTASGAYIITI